MKKHIFCWLSTSKDVVIPNIAACTENENHVESSGAEEKTRSQICWIVIRLASLHATRHQTSWQGRPTPAEMSQCWGGNIGMLTFFLTFIYSGKACWTCSLFPNNQYQSSSIQLHCWGLPASLISIFNVCRNTVLKQVTHSFLNQISQWVRGFEPAFGQPQTTWVGFTV